MPPIGPDCSSVWHRHTMTGEETRTGFIAPTCAPLRGTIARRGSPSIPLLVFFRFFCVCASLANSRYCGDSSPPLVLDKFSFGFVRPCQRGNSCCCDGGHTKAGCLALIPVRWRWALRPCPPCGSSTATTLNTPKRTCNFSAEMQFQCACIASRGARPRSDDTVRIWPQGQPTTETTRRKRDEEE